MTFILYRLVSYLCFVYQKRKEKQIKQMQRLKQKQLQRIKQELLAKQQNYEALLRQWLAESQQLTQSILYAQDSLQSIHELITTTKQNHDTSNQHNIMTKPPPIKLSYEEQFTPSSISKLVFEKDLIKIKQMFNILPDGKARIEHFVLIMMKVLFVDPSVLLKKEKEEKIMKDLLKIQHQKAKIGQNLSTITTKPVSPKKVKLSPTSSPKHPIQSTPMRPVGAIQQHPQQAIDSYPYYIMSLEYMFNQIVLPSSNTITFGQLQKFIMGESISTNKIDNSNTQFKIEFEQNKVQDFLLHFSGIKKLIYCRNLNIYLCLDVGDRLIKIYSHQLKYNRNYQPNTLRHNRRSPEIVDMWFVDFGNVLGLVLADHTVEIVNLQAFLTEQYDKKFLLVPKNCIVVKIDVQLRSIYYLQMYNRWLIVGQGQEMFEVNVSKYRSKDEEITIITPLRNQKPQHPITQILEIISLSIVCIVAGNEIWFYDEKLSRKTYHRYVHEENISVVKFIEQRNCFYLCGLNEKFLTVLKPHKKRQTMETVTMTFSKPIIEFDVFPMFNSILLIDDKYTVRLISEETKQVYQTQQYNRIVKQDQIKINDQEKRKKISLIKINNENFMMYESYMVSLSLAKVPVETEMEFEFLPYFYFDTIKEDITVSFNNQILVISLLEAELRETFTLDNSNLQPLSYFFYTNSPIFKPFAFSESSTIFQLCHGQIEMTSDNDQKKFKKKLQIKNVIYSHFQQDLARFIAVSHQQLCQVRNERDNKFTTVNITNFSNFEVLSVSYINKRKVLLMNCISTTVSDDTTSISKYPKSTSLLSQSNSSSTSLIPSPSSPQQFILELNINQMLEYKMIKYDFEKIEQDDKSPLILRCLQIEQYGVRLLLTDENVVYIVGREQQGNNSDRRSICIKFYHFIAPKVRDLLKFTDIYFYSLPYNVQPLLLQRGYQKQKTYNSLFLTSEQGFFIQIRLNHLLNTYFTNFKQLKSIERFSSSLPQVCQLDYLTLNKNNENISIVKLTKTSSYTFQNNQREQFSLIKAHNACKIDIITKVFIEYLYTISIGRDGFLKMWNQQKECVISLKLPTLRRQTFDVKVIKQIRFQRVLQLALQTMRRIVPMTQRKVELNDILTKTRNQQLEKQYMKIDQSEPIKIDIQNKDIEEIINEQPLYTKTIDMPYNLVQKFHRRYGDRNQYRSKNFTLLNLKKKRSFENILQKSPPRVRNSIAIPSQLLELRKQLHIFQGQKSKTIEHKISRKQQKQLLILPKLKDYKMQTFSKGFKTDRQLISNELLTDSQEESEYDNFQACTFVKKKRGLKKANELDRIDKEFIRKQFTMIVKKNLTKKKDAVQILSNRVQQEKIQMEDPPENRLSIDMIVKDIKRIKYESKYGGERHIPKVKFKSYSQKD